MEVDILLSTSPPAQEDKTHNISAFSKVSCCDAYKIDTSDTESKRILQMYCITTYKSEHYCCTCIAFMYYNVFICIVCTTTTILSFTGIIKLRYILSSDM